MPRKENEVSAEGQTDVVDVEAEPVDPSAPVPWVTPPDEEVLEEPEQVEEAAPVQEEVIPDGYTKVTWDGWTDQVRVGDRVLPRGVPVLLTVEEAALLNATVSAEAEQAVPEGFVKLTWAGWGDAFSFADRLFHKGVPVVVSTVEAETLAENYSEFSTNFVIG